MNFFALIAIAIKSYFKVENLSVGGATTILLGKVGEQSYNSTGNLVTGNITTQGLNVLNNGSFTAGEIVSTDGDIEITSLNDVTVERLKGIRGSASIISGTGNITLNNFTRADDGFVALAEQNILTKEIRSTEDAVILKSSNGEIKVKGTIEANDDVSLAASKRVVANKIISADGGVAVISATDKVILNSDVSSMEDVILGSAKFLKVKKITSQLGEVALVSTEGAIRVNGAIKSAFDVSISAKQSAITNSITTQGGAVAVETKAGAVNILDAINSDGGNIQVSAGAIVNTKNITSNGGVINLISRNKYLKTGLLRSDVMSTTGVGGKIYLQAGAEIIVEGSANIGGTNYSIYTGVSDKEWVTIAHELKTPEASRSTFSTDNTAAIGTKSGTKSEVLGEIAFRTEPPNPVTEALKLLIIEIFEALTESSPNPSNVVDINPITGNPYRNDSDRALVEQMTPQQRKVTKQWINKNSNRAVLLDEEEVFDNGQIDDNGCFSAELGIHYGDWFDSRYGQLNITHSVYATQVTGANGDYFVVTPLGNASLFDGLVNASGRIVGLGYESPGSVAEVKTGQQQFLRKALFPEDPAYLDWNVTEQDRNNLDRFERQLFRELAVATTCGITYFMSFSNSLAAQAADSLYGDVVKVYDIPVLINL